MAGAVTAGNLIVEALHQIAVYAHNETPTDSDMEQGLTILNDMLDSWSNESLTCYAILEQTGTLIAGVSSYTIGPGGAFNMTRPLRLIEGPGAAYSQDVNGNNYYINVVPRNEWNLIGNRTSVMNSNFVFTMFYDPQFPLGVINVYPQPNQGAQMFWDSYLQLTDFTTIYQAVNLPPGYKKAIQDSLALMFWPYWKTGEPSQRIVGGAAISKGNIKRTNIRTVRAFFDPEIVSDAAGTYNVYTDSYTNRT